MDEIKTKIANDASSVLGELYRDLAQPSVRAIGKALGNVFELLPVMTLPLKYWSEKKKLNLTKRLIEFAKKLEDIPEENCAEVPPEIGVPIVDRLVYTTNDELADLFMTLLANASNIDTLHIAHPSFIKIIESLCVDEARIIKFLSERDNFPYCNFRGRHKDGKGIDDIIQDSTISDDIELYYPNCVNFYLDNLVSQGILYKESWYTLLDEKGYDRIKDKHYDSLKAKLVPSKYKDIEVFKGFYEVTNLGKMFIKACIQ